MALPQIISRNQTQKIPTSSINLRKTLTGGSNGDWYTCPAEKKAIIKGKVTCTDRGAAATVDFIVAGTTMFTWSVGLNTPLPYLDAPFRLTTGNGGQVAEFDVQLDAGEKLIYAQNSGTNASMNMNVTIQETPA